jgi:hypothetical protein
VTSDAVTLAYVHPEEVAHSWHASLIELIGWDFSHEGRIMRGGRLAVKYGSGGLVAARNEAAGRFLAECTDSDWLFWIDTDMGFAPDAVDRLLEVADPRRRPIVGGLCFAQKETKPDGLGGYRCEPRVTIFDFIQSPEQTGFMARTRYPINTVVQCAGTGSACILIHRSVLQRIFDEFGPIWYDRIPNPSTGKLFGEDLSFCMRTQALNIPLFVHTGVKTNHLKQLWLQEADYWSYAVAPPATEAAAVLVPASAPVDVELFCESLRASTGLATVYAVANDGEDAAAQAWKRAGAEVIVAQGAGGFAERMNAGCRETSEPWVAVIGDAARFHPGWLDHAQALAADLYHVVGTNDLSSPRVVAGHHSPNLLIRRSYVADRGASWDGPGVLAHEGYTRWFVDDEIVTVAKQRDVWAMALGAHVERASSEDDVDEAVFAADEELFERRVSMPRDPQVDAFTDAAGVLDAAGVTWWISDGAVLGHVRDGGFVATDPDVDLGFWADDLPVVERAFEAAGWRRLPSNDFKLLRDRVSVDLHAHVRDGDRVFFELGNGKYRYVFPAHVFGEFDRVEFNGRQVLTPSPAEDYLEAHYGPGWRTPVKNWRWDADPPCLERVS